MDLYRNLSCVLLLSQVLLAQSSSTPCPKDAKFADRNQIDYTIKVRGVRGRVIVEGDQEAIAGARVALFDATHSKLLREVQADENGSFTIEPLSSGDYWLSVKDPQQALCPAAVRLHVRRTAVKSKIVVVMKVAGIDTCSYCKTE